MNTDSCSRPKADQMQILRHKTPLGLEFSTSQAQKLVYKQLGYAKAVRKSRLAATL